jgi:hypothetical protein
MRICCASILLATVCLAVASTQVQHFRVGALDPDPERDTRRALWYSEELKLLGEPSLWEPTPGQNTESCRFLWLRSFQPDLSVRLDVNGDGTASLTTKEQTTLFLATIEEHRFCNLPSADSYRGAMELIGLSKGIGAARIT